MAAPSSLSPSVSESASSVPTELCTYCCERPYDVVCACGDGFDFTCIQRHVEHIGREFHYAQNVTGEQLLYVEEMVEYNKCERAKAMVENWKRKRIQDVTDIADEVLNRIRDREDTYSDVTLFRSTYNALSEQSHIVHEQLHAIIALQRQIAEKYDQLRALSDLCCGATSLDAKLLSYLHPDVFSQTTVEEETEPRISFSQSTPTREIESLVRAATPVTYPIETVLSLGSTDTVASPTTESINFTATVDTPQSPETSPTALEDSAETSPQLANTYSGSRPANDTFSKDEFEVGYTLYIQRQNPIAISTGNDKFASTVCCHGRQLLYNNYHQRSRQTRLTLIPDIAQPAVRQIIEWTPPAATISGGDDDWIQDIAYCSKLQGYFLLSRARLRLLRSDSYQLEEFAEFPDRSMKRVTCDATYIYLVCAAGSTGQHGDEIILMNYAKEEKRRKTFRDLILIRNNHISGPLIGEISDLAVNTTGQIMLAYRFERRREVGIYVYNVTNDGRDWTSARRIVLNDCWTEDLCYTPRTEWCEKLGVFVVVEYLTGHLIMLDETGQVRGECRFTYGQVQRESPLNVSVSENNFLCVRYESSVNIYQLEETIA